MSNATLTNAQKTIVLREARKDYVRLQTMLADYREACEEDRRNGHRAHYCVHGVNMWVDYDCACGQCEDGETLYDLEAKTPADVMRETLDTYRYEWPKIELKIKDVLDHMMAVGCLNEISSEHRNAVVSLSCDIINDMQGRWKS